MHLYSKTKDKYGIIVRNTGFGGKQIRNQILPGSYTSLVITRVFNSSESQFPHWKIITLTRWTKLAKCLVFYTLEGLGRRCLHWYLEN